MKKGYNLLDLATWSIIIAGIIIMTIG